MRRLALAVIPLLALLTPVHAAASDESWSWPVGREGLGRTFDPPADAYGPGHRGIDIAAPAGTRVRAVAPGTVAFVGQVGGIQVVSIDHGGSRSTYQPVRGSVRVGDSVDRGQPIGVLLGSHGSCTGPCLHLGRKVGDTYLDPLDLLGGGLYRLVTPNGPPPRPPLGLGDGLRPVAGPITSSFGMRVHPITGVRKLHDGVDIGARCGTPVKAAAAGKVTQSRTAGGYGKRVLIAHGNGTSTGYAHLSASSVKSGQRVRRGQVIGHVGSTGMSTGCHLHLMLRQGGRWVNPARLL